MYVALRELKISVSGEDGQTKVQVIPPGKPVPGAEGWPYPNLIAHLNLGLIKWGGEKDYEAPHHSHKQRGGVVIPITSKKSEKSAEIAQQSDSPTEDLSAQPSATTLDPAPAPQAQASGSNSCCGREFKTSAALKSHIRSKHPGSESETKAG